MRAIEELAGVIRTGIDADSGDETAQENATRALDEMLSELVEPEAWRDEKSTLKGFDPSEDPREVVERLGYIYVSLNSYEEAPPDKRSVALEALRLASAQIERAEAAERRAEDFTEAREAVASLLRWVDLVLPTSLVKGRGNDEYFDLNLRASSVWNVQHAADAVRTALRDVQGEQPSE